MLFIGSSRAYHGFVPEEFDRVLAERGPPELRSFNLGITGLRLYGVVDLARRLRDVLPSAPAEGGRWVLVDPESPELFRDRQDRLMRGVVNWYDPPAARSEIGWILSSDMPGEQKREFVAQTLLALAVNLGNVGRAVPWIEDLLDLAVAGETLDERRGPRGDGFRAKGWVKAEQVERKHEEFLLRERAWPHRVEQLARMRAPREPLTRWSRDLFARIQSEFARLGAETVFVIQPSLYLQGELIQAHRQGLVPNLLRFNQPARRPELYAFETRWEESHPNELGARLFTRTLAAEFADFLDARP